MDKTTIGKIISAVIGLALMGAAVALILTGNREGTDTIIDTALLVLGAIGTLATPRLTEKKS